MGMSIDDLKKECQYCYREIDNSGLEGFRCSNRSAIRAMDSGWCYPKCANEPCSICEYCKPMQEDMKITVDEAIRRIDEHNYIHQRKEPRAIYISEALDMAVAIMRKYQRICKILDKSDNGEQCMYDTIQEIEEVRNGNDD
jgi:hypothetical protein